MGTEKHGQILTDICTYMISISTEWYVLADKIQLNQATIINTLLMATNAYYCNNCFKAITQDNLH